jgi:hypothetical protein
MPARRAAYLAIALATAALAFASVALAQPAQPDAGVRIVISIAARRLWVVDMSGDTLLSAPAAVGSGRTLRGPDRSWTFQTPRGITVVTKREENPVWVPPDWHYVEVARKLKLRVQRLDAARPVPLPGGDSIVVRNDEVGVLHPDSSFVAVPVDEEIIFGGTLFIPPLGTRNRRVERALGPYRLVLANGIGIHGTPFTDSIGRAVTHGCIRLTDDDIGWLYAHVPVGARVIIQ